MVFGTLLSVLGVWAFRRVRTTVSPLNPEQTEHFVSDGVYRFSRNPMYAGMGCWLVAWAGYMAHPLPWLFLAAFVVYMTRFQIMPEERVLARKFGAEYEAYCRHVRRWL
nr:isoprenylcysteine carboxylmethyltransferase family protein [Neisseria cinerea]